MENKKKILLVVLDSAGVGALPDAAEFGDTGANTVGHIIERRGLNTPNLDKLGLRSIKETGFTDESIAAEGCYGRAAEKTHAKDTTCGHFEIAGYIMEKPFKVYPKGFPRRLIEEFERRIGYKTMGNRPASGTKIIEELGDDHVLNGCPIVYTSADSVFQIAAHESILPLEELYRICGIAREMLMGDDLVGRVIARPFDSNDRGEFFRTENRKDFALPPDQDTVLNALEKAGYDVVGIGKIEDIFCKSGITEVDHTRNNPDGIEATVKYAASDKNGLIFTNLVDFDMLYGHRNDVEGYGRALEQFDEQLPRIIEAMGEEDLLIITADHGCDPTTKSTDHSREYVPIMVYGKNIKQNVDLGTRETFADIAATIAEFFGIGAWHTGTSFLSMIRK